MRPISIELNFPHAFGDLDLKVFDADLTLASSTGSIIDYVDDRGAGDFEQIEMTLNEGCYVIGVSSPNTLETGSYTLTVD